MYSSKMKTCLRNCEETKGYGKEKWNDYLIGYTLSRVFKVRVEIWYLFNFKNQYNIKGKSKNMLDIFKLILWVSFDWGEKCFSTKLFSI